jgi:phosphoserine aminotransferase
MSRVHNFSAGPAALPESVLRQAQEEMLEWHGVGASIVELSHRGPEFIQVATEAEADLRRLMSIPDDYAVLFLAAARRPCRRCCRSTSPSRARRLTTC